MGYKTDHNELRKRFAEIEDKGARVSYQDVEMFQLPFTSRSVKLPVVDGETENSYLPEFAKGDSDFFENNVFNYTVFSPMMSPTKGDMILMLHGLNERSYDKYLPWAFRLAKQTGKSVVLFPIANHMNRSPKEWNNPRQMLPWVKRRLSFLTSTRLTTFANLALSERLTNRPERFFLSGFQAAKDIENLIGDIRSERHPFFSSEAKVDFFAYSIGVLLLQTMLLAKSSPLMDDSKFFFFCGGSVFNRMQGTSKFILDSNAFDRLMQFYNNDVDSFAERNAWFARFFKGTAIGNGFDSMISYEKLKQNASEAFTNLKERIMAVSLKQDKVVLPEEIQRTLSCLNVQTLDFPFRYSHENPFPVYDGDKEAKVDKAFDDVFGRACNFLA